MTFEYAWDLQEKHWVGHQTISNPSKPAEYVDNLTHVELDVEGFDAFGERIRMLRILDTSLEVLENRNLCSVVEETTMEFKRTLVLKSPAGYSLLALKVGDR